METTVNSVVEDEILRRLRDGVEGKGLELYPFKIGWYNSRVQKPFLFPDHEDTLGVVAVSSPSMFEKLFLPYLDQHVTVLGQDPLDQCLREELRHLAGLFPSYQVEVIQDYELLPSRRPKVLVQTAGHVAGAAYYYQRTDVDPQPWNEKSKIFGVSMHPRYGGWFALRGVLLFHGLLVPGLMQQEPVDCVSSREMRIKLLEKFNYCWRDWTYRDVTEREILERYSDQQRTYFATEPRDRFDLIKKWKQESSKQLLDQDH